ncbi:MAG: hypothetical protein IPK26_11275 [Planctomycetes bacterium]|nr:hypothetical protein [Planctomycetota bacterium]
MPVPKQGLFVVATLIATAQAQVNPFVLYPQDPERQALTCTSFVGRPDLSRAAEALVEFDDQQFRGIGDALGFHRIFGVYHWVADERLATVETYDLIIRIGASTGGPDTTPAGLVFRVASLTTPPSANPARGTWIMYDGFNIQGGFTTILSQTWYLGVGLPANPAWPATDGHALFRADLLSANTGATVGENHRAGVLGPTWAVPANGAPFRTPWTYVCGPFVTTPNLHMGGLDPTSNRLGAPGASFGIHGLFPDVGGAPRRDGLMLRFTDNLTPFAFAFLGASLGFALPQWEPGIIGSNHIGTSGQVITVGLPRLQNGVAEVTIALPGTIPTAMIGNFLAFQGVVWDPNTRLANWSNAQAVSF